MARVLHTTPKHTRLTEGGREREIYRARHECKDSWREGGRKAEQIKADNSEQKQRKTERLQETPREEQEQREGPI